jgi:hypothetical protein
VSLAREGDTARAPQPSGQPVQFSRPKLKDGCTVTRAVEGMILSYLGEDYTFELDDPARALPVERFLLSLDGSRPATELTDGGAGLPPDEARIALRLLDESLLLTEAAPPPAGKSGLAFATELEDLYYNVWTRQEGGETELVRSIFDGKAERAVILGWCLESYHVTSRAHDCLSPMLARFHGAFKRKAIAYFLDEYRHDKLIMKSLLAAGFRRDDVERCLPLPYTHAVMNLLARWAHSDLLSFMGCLFVFEGTPEIGDGYIASLAQYDLPEEFVKGQSVHNDINNDGGHGNITRDFFAMSEQIAPDDQARVIRNLRMLYEAQRCKHDDVLRYYRAPTVGAPRLLPPAASVGGAARTAAEPRPSASLAVAELAARWPLGSARRSFWAAGAPRDRGALRLLLDQVRYLHERLVDALAAVLDRIRPDEARHALSRMLVRHARALIERDRAETEVVPLPGTEAIANQLFIAAATDWPVFLSLVEPVTSAVLPMEELRRLAGEAADLAHATDLDFLDAASDLDELRACLACVEGSADTTVERARAQAFLLFETADLLYEGLAGPARPR